MPGLGIGIGMGMGVGRAQASLFDRVHSELFGSGEQGIYMPSVHESFVRGDLYQDAAGTTPVTAVGQSVGLWLDRSRGLVLGPELVVTQDLTDASWLNLPGTPASSRTNNTLTFGGQYSGIRHYIPATAGKAFEFAFEIRRISGNASLNLYNDPNQTLNITTAGGLPITVTDNWQQFSVIRICKGPSIDVGIQDRNATGHGTVELRNISICELPGNHAYQPTAASRPALQQDANGMYVLRFDGVNDFLQAAFDPGAYPFALIAGAATTTAVEGGQVSVSITASDFVYATIGSAGGAGNARADSRSQEARFTPTFVTTGRRVTTGIFASSTLTLRVNGEERQSVVITNEWTSPRVTYIGKIRPSGLFHTGDIYGLIACGAAKSVAQIERAEALVNRYTRAY